MDSKGSVTETMGKPEEFKAYRLEFVKEQSEMQTSGYYPHQDKILARVEVPRHYPYPVPYDFVFIREGVVSSPLDPDDPMHDILLENGIEIDLEAHPIWDKHVTTFKEAGFSRSDNIDKFCL